MGGYCGPLRDSFAIFGNPTCFLNRAFCNAAAALPHNRYIPDEVPALSMLNLIQFTASASYATCGVAHASDSFRYCLLPPRQQ